MSAEERLEFAVTFATMDLKGLRPGDWLNLRDDLTSFIGSAVRSVEEVRRDHMGRMATVVCRPDETGQMAVSVRPLAETGRVATTFLAEPFSEEEVPESAIRKLQAETLRILKSVIKVFGTNTGNLEMPQSRLTLALTLIRTPEGVMLLGDGPQRDIFLFNLLVLLKLQPVDRLRACPECSRIFYRKRRQKYCSRDCTNRVSVRRWRQKQITIATSTK